MSIAIAALEDARSYRAAMAEADLVDLSHYPVTADELFPCRVALSAAVAAEVLDYPGAITPRTKFGRSLFLLRACRAALLAKGRAVCEPVAFDVGFVVGGDPGQVGARRRRIPLRAIWSQYAGAPLLLIVLADGGGGLEEVVV
jgi:hypothetical protein